MCSRKPVCQKLLQKNLTTSESLPSPSSSISLRISSNENGTVVAEGEATGRVAVGWVGATSLGVTGSAAGVVVGIMDGLAKCGSYLVSCGSLCCCCC
jgi:hypothetical protein